LAGAEFLLEDGMLNFFHCLPNYSTIQSSILALQGNQSSRGRIASRGRNSESTLASNTSISWISPALPVAEKVTEKALFA
jgi:hypothetical protein